MEKEKQYYFEVMAASMERTIKRLWIVIIILASFLVGTNAAWVWYESQFETVSVTQEVEQESEENGTNSFIGGDYYGTAESENDGQAPR